MADRHRAGRAGRSALAGDGGSACAANLAGGTHHAHRDFGSGFCVFNDAAIAALAMRADAGEGADILAAIDARMGEIYAASFRRAGDAVIATSHEIVIAPADHGVPAGDGWFGVGTGFAAADAVLASRLQGRWAGIDAGALPHAADVARLGALAFARGEAVAPERIEPAYLRNNVALTIAEQQALRAKRG